jgi:hypothetical protein
MRGESLRPCSPRSMHASRPDARCFMCSRCTPSMAIQRPDPPQIQTASLAGMGQGRCREAGVRTCACTCPPLLGCTPVLVPGSLALVLTSFLSCLLWRGRGVQVEEKDYAKLVAKRREEGGGFIVDDEGLGCVRTILPPPTPADSSAPCLAQLAASEGGQTAAAVSPASMGEGVPWRLLAAAAGTPQSARLPFQLRAALRHMAVPAHGRGRIVS